MNANRMNEMNNRNLSVAQQVVAATKRIRTQERLGFQPLAVPLFNQKPASNKVQ